MKVFRAWLEFLAKQTRPPEDSKVLRGLVGLNVTVAILAVGYSLEWPLFSRLGLLLTGAAMLLSYAFRRRNNWDVKAFLSVSMMLALVNFLMGLSANLADPRLPLAELLVWLQTLHSFDLPGRRDLNYSLLVALVLMSIAAVLSVYGTYAFFLLAYTLTALAALHLNYRRALAEIGLDLAGTPRRPPFAVLGLLLLGGAIVLLLLPRFQSFRIRALPMSLQMRLSLPRVSSGKIKNSAFPSTSDPEEFRKQAKFDPDSYAGFNSVVDLQLRGHLSTEVVLRVRSSRPANLRGLAFDKFDGSSWVQSNPRPVKLQFESSPHILEVDFNPRLPDGAGTSADYVRENVQIIYVEKQLPNLVLASSEPVQLYFPSDELYRDAEDGILSPYPMESGTIYSVISSEVREVPALLKRLPLEDPRIRLLRKKYTALPSELQGDNRVHQLALKITGSATSNYEKILALVNYLHQNYTYDLDVPAYPEGVDAVDYFLFEQKSGYCEQFATTLTIMARSIGLPSLYVTGFLPGTYNPLTGYHEVRGNDAHAWSEIWIPNYGWLSFDATPPGTARLTDEQDSEQSSSLGVALLHFLIERVGRDKFYALLVAGAAAVLLAGFLSWLRGRRLQVQESYFQEATRLVSARFPNLGVTHGQTPRQLAARINDQDYLRLCQLHEQEKYQGLSLAPGEMGEIKPLLQRLRQRLEDNSINAKE